jgi:hypothetical protein
MNTDKAFFDRMNRIYRMKTYFAHERHERARKGRNAQIWRTIARGVRGVESIGRVIPIKMQ